MVQQAEDLVYGLSQASVRGDFVDAERLVNGSLDRLVAASERGVEITGLATGYADLDKMTGGLRPANLVVVAARPSMGKTALALGMAANAALDDGKTVAIFSIEMSADEIVGRMLSSVAMVDGSRLRTGRLSQDDWPRIGQAADRLGQVEALHRRLRRRDRRRDAHQGAAAQEPPWARPRDRRLHPADGRRPGSRATRREPGPGDLDDLARRSS